MSFNPINFESSRVKEKERQELRDIRQSILSKAETEYNERQKKEREAKNRGDDKWMLPSLEAKLSQSDKSSKKKKKEKKKKKKHKKEKKKKRDSSSSSSESEEEVWVEKTKEESSDDEKKQEQIPLAILEQQSNADAESWNQISSFGTYTREEMREREGNSRQKAKEEERRKRREADKPGTHARELNPYYKDGGSGLPQNITSSPSLGMDAQWLKKALIRAKDQAKEKGITLEEVAAQRWGSLEKFYQLLANAEKEEERKSQEKAKDREYPRDKEYERDREYRRGRDNRDYHRYRDREKGDSRYSKESESRYKSKSDHKSKYSDRKERRRKYSSSSEDETDRSKHRLLKPGENTDYENTSSSHPKSKSNRAVWDDRPRERASSGWKKREPSPPREKRKSPPHSSSSSSSSSESSEDEQKIKIPEAPKVNDESEIKSNKEIVKESMKPILTDKQMNDLAAKLVKAELMGNEAQIEKLKKKLNDAREARDNQGIVQNETPDTNSQKEETVVLMRTDNKGNVRPVSVGEENSDVHSHKKKKMKTHGDDGKRKQYFPDDDKYDLKKMFEREKATSAEDQNMLYERAAVTNSEKLDDDFDVDDMFIKNATKKDDTAKQEERDKQKAIQEHQRQQKSLDNCRWCFESKEMQKHLIVSLGEKCYISLPHHESLTTGHCLIVPIHHVTCGTQADQDLWEEMNIFRRALVRMFQDQGEDCIFFETAKKLRNFPHMALHCIPLPKEVGDTAPIYFKKAIMECETEWSVNKKLVDLNNRDVRRAVPKGLPYFFVDFAMSPGYAHVIEDEQEFPSNFAQEIVGNILDVDQNLWRKPRKENFDLQRKKVMHFFRMFKEYDPTNK